MTTTVYAGKCKGGPWDGQCYEHWTNKIEFFEPVLRPLNWFSLENAEVIPHKIGKSYWGKNGLWIWLPEGTQSRRKAL